MSANGTWFVLCERARALPLEQLAEQIRGRRGVTTVDVGAVVTVQLHDARTGRDANITVGLSTEPHVVLESAEIAERHAADRPDRDQIAAADARYELHWELRVTDEVYNTLAVIAGELEKACGAVIFDVTNGSFV
jgi:hypothetical protein